MHGVDDLRLNERVEISLAPPPEAGGDAEAGAGGDADAEVGTSLFGRKYHAHLDVVRRRGRGRGRGRRRGRPRTWTWACKDRVQRIVEGRFGDTTAVAVTFDLDLALDLDAASTSTSGSTTATVAHAAADRFDRGDGLSNLALGLGEERVAIVLDLGMMVGVVCVGS